MEKCSPIKNSKLLKKTRLLMSIVAHRFGRVEYLLLFSTRKRSWKNQNKYSKFDKFKDINRDITNNSGKISKWKITRRTVVPWFANFPTPMVCFTIFFTFSQTQLSIVRQLLRQFRNRVYSFWKKQMNVLHKPPSTVQQDSNDPPSKIKGQLGL